MRVQVQRLLSAPGWQAGCWRCWQGGQASGGLHGREKVLCERQSQHSKLRQLKQTLLLQ